MVRKHGRLNTHQQLGTLIAFLVPENESMELSRREFKELFRCKT